MSSHREAPEISKDPVADNPDLYAFVDPNDSSKVTILANYIPLEEPAGGPNFFQFGDDVLYEIKIDTDGDARADVTYQFRFKTRITNPETFLYNTGPITSLTSPSWNVRQTYTVTRVTGRDNDDGGQRRVLGADLISPPVRIGPRSTPTYTALATAAIQSLPGGVTVFAGQRDEGFYVDLGSIFDLGALRPFQNLHLLPLPAVRGVNGTKHLNVHSIALQVPIVDLTRDGSSRFSDAADPKAVIGVWTAAYRRKAIIRGDGDDVESGPWIQVSRLGNPLFNEVIVPMSNKDRWNELPPTSDSTFVQYVQHPELAKLLPVLYPGVFPNLAAATGSRDDLVAILLTGIPSGIISGFQNFTGTTLADMLRLNMAIVPSSSPNILGLVGGDAAGFPNGRRVADDVVTIELRAIAGVTYPLVNPGFTPDGAAGLIYDIEDPATNTPPVSYLSSFPYLNHPESGFDVPS